jgi:hypothetical protein
VGFELEFSGLTLDEAADALRASIGGDLKTVSAAERELHVDSLGSFNVELDWDYLKRKAAQTARMEGDDEWLDLLSQAATLLVPMEVVCPPIPVTRLDALETIVAGLRAAGAVGTEDSPLAAYGVHVNAEIARIDAATISSHLRAFALLQWWLVEAHEVDMTRRISPYVDLYPEPYLRRLLSGPGADIDRIFADYLDHNATRNRALDLLPLLSEIDSERVRRAIDDPKIKARPTFHYRLPNCHIERTDWSLASAWNSWWLVEELAHRPDDLNELATAFLDAGRPIIGVSRNGWITFVDQWLRDRELV